MSLTVLHVADIKLDPYSGMGRIAVFWKKAFEEAGHQFIHIGKEEVKVDHPSKFPGRALKVYKEKYQAKKPDVILAHEPVSGKFIGENIPVVLFSHGIEQREWNLRNSKYKKFHEAVSMKSRILFPIWRLTYCNRGLRNANLLLLSNKEDQNYAIEKYKRKREDIIVFRNGIKNDFLVQGFAKVDQDVPTIGFSGTWIKRKGTDLIVDAAKELLKNNIKVKWLLFGTVFTKEDVLKDFPDELHSDIQVIPTFDTQQEKHLFEQCDIFILPSFFEGQSLALLQGMASGLCCITSDCCAQLDLIQHKSNGLLFKTGDAMDLAIQMRLALEDTLLRSTLGKNARSSVEDREWPKVSKEIVGYIERIA